MTTVHKEVRKAIEKIPKGKVFGYQHLPMPPGKTSAVTQAIYRMIKEGTLKRFKKGIFYRPQKGYSVPELLPDSMSILETYLMRDKKRIGYITGFKLYNQLGLTTQYPFVFDVASHLPLPNLAYHGSYLRVEAVKSYVEVTDDNYEVLQFLDLLRYFKFKILDLNEESVIRYFITRLTNMSRKERKKVIHLALSYPPRIRAFLGALLEEGGLKEGLKKLQDSLNPLSSYRLHTRWYYLPSSKKWKLYDDFTQRKKPV